MYSRNVTCKPHKSLWCSPLYPSGSSLNILVWRPLFQVRCNPFGSPMDESLKLQPSRNTKRMDLLREERGSLRSLIIAVFRYIKNCCRLKGYLFFFPLMFLITRTRNDYLRLQSCKEISRFLFNKCGAMIQWSNSETALNDRKMFKLFQFRFYSRVWKRYKMLETSHRYETWNTKTYELSDQRPRKVSIKL